MTEEQEQSNDDTWIYLSDKLILEYLTNDTSKCAIAHFYRRILIPNYQEEVEYKLITKNHDLVVQQNLTKRTSNRKKYYAVTEKVYKSLLERRKYVKKSKNPEQIICDRLNDELQGKREVYIEGKRIDVLTPTEIIEVKCYRNMLSAVGQILYYSTYYPEHIKRIHLFDHKGEKDIKYEKICKMMDILVTYE